MMVCVCVYVGCCFVWAMMRGFKYGNNNEQTTDNGAAAPAIIIVTKNGVEFNQLFDVACQKFLCHTHKSTRAHQLGYIYTYSFFSLSNLRILWHICCRCVNEARSTVYSFTLWHIQRALEIPRLRYVPKNLYK